MRMTPSRVCLSLLVQGVLAFATWRALAEASTSVPTDFRQRVNGYCAAITGCEIAEVSIGAERGKLARTVVLSLEPGVTEADQQRLVANIKKEGSESGSVHVVVKRTGKAKHTEKAGGSKK